MSGKSRLSEVPSRRLGFCRTNVVVDSILCHLSQFTRNMELVSSVRKRGHRMAPADQLCLAPSIPTNPRVNASSDKHFFLCSHCSGKGIVAIPVVHIFLPRFLFYFIFLFLISFLIFPSFLFFFPLLLFLSSCLLVSSFLTHSLSILWPHNCHCLPFRSNPFSFGLESGDSLLFFRFPSPCTTYARHRCLTSVFM